MRVRLLFLCVDILKMRPECVCLHSQIRISTCVQKKIPGVFVCLYIPKCVSAQCMCVCLLFKGGKAGALLKAY